MTSDKKIEAHLKNNAPDVDFDKVPEEELKYAIDAMKKLTPEQLDYITRNTAEPT